MNRIGYLFCGLLAAALASEAAGASAYVWTGAADNYWTNAANWSLDGAVPDHSPGIPMTEVTTKVDEKNNWGKYYLRTTAGTNRTDDVSEFGAISSGRTTINLDGLFSIKQITIKSGAPRYQFGTSEKQVLPMGHNGSLILESGLKNMPDLKAQLLLGAAIPMTWVARTTTWTYTTTTSVTIQNNTGLELTINNYGDDRPEMATYYLYQYLYLKGTGNYRLAGTNVITQSHQDDVCPYLYAPKTTIANNVDKIGQLFFMAKGLNLEILKGCTLSFGNLNGRRIETYYADCSITGQGTLLFDSYSTSYLNVGRNVELLVSTPFGTKKSSAGAEQGSYIRLYGSSGAAQNGVLHLTGYNSSSVPFAFVNGYRTLKISALDAIGPVAPIQFQVDGKLETAFETEQTLAQAVAIKNGCTAVFVNGGTAKLTVKPTVTHLTSGTAAVNVSLLAKTSDIVLSSPTVTKASGQTVCLVVGGTHPVSINAAGDLTGFDTIRFTGGTFDASSVANWSSPSATFDTGATTITVPDGEIYTFSKLTRSGSSGTINFVCRTGRVKLTDPSYSAGDTPAGVCVNGYQALVRTDRILVTESAKFDTEIAAKGDEVPNAPAKTIGITKEGSGGNDTLAAGQTAVSALWHNVEADSTIEIGAGRSFTAALVRLVNFSYNLNIGVAGDEGTFGTAGAALQLWNEDPNADLTVNARLADRAGVTVTGSRRAPILAGGSVTSNDLSVTGTFAYNKSLVATGVTEAASLTVTGARRYAFDAVTVGTNVAVTASDPAEWPTVRFDGAKDVVLGARGVRVGSPCAVPSGVSDAFARGHLVVTNSHLTSDDTNRRTYSDTKGQSERCSIVVGNYGHGFLEIRDGAVITNRLVVGSPANVSRSLGFVRQTGGTVAALGDWTSSATCARGSSVARAASHGHYLLEGGTLAALGGFTIGHDATGFLVQTGGTFTVGYHPADTSHVGTNALYLGMGTAGDGNLWISGGRCEAPGGILMCGGGTTADSRATVTVEGPATLDAGAGPILMTHATTLTGAHYSFFNVRSGAVVRAACIADYSKMHGAADTVAKRHEAVNFDGGTFRAGANDRSLFRGIDHVFVYGGGVTVDTDGKAGNYIDVPLAGVTGNGVSAISPALIQETYGVPPVIEIFDDSGVGEGATAAVDWDPETRTVRGIRITSPGSGYGGAAYARFRLGPISSPYYYTKGGTSSAALAVTQCELAANATAGGFTKTGDGTLALKAANTWGGATHVLGGGLALGCDGALPDGTAVYVGGGAELDFNGTCQSVSRLTYLAGGGHVSNFSGVTFAEEDVFAITTAELAEGKAIRLKGNFDLSKVTIRLTGDPSLLREGVRYELASTDGAFTGAPEQDFEPALLRWGARIHPTRIVLSVSRGFRVIVR